MNPVTSALADTERPVWLLALLALRMPAAVSALCLLGLHYFGFLVFHVLAEGMSILIAVMAMAVATTSLRFTRNHFLIFVAIAFGWCAALDFIHTLTFKGMNLLPVDSGATTQYWVAARYLQAAALMASTLMLRRQVRPLWLHIGFAAAASAAALLIATGHFPVTFVEGQGLTPFKIISEYIIIAMLGCSVLLFRKHRLLMSRRLYLGISAAVVMMMLSELSLTRYVDLYAAGPQLGHVLKIFAYWYVYLALVRSTLSEPFNALARAASTYDAVPDPVMIITANGVIKQANTAAALHARLPAEQLVGCTIHELFHESAIPPADCPVCSRLARDSAGFETDLSLPLSERTVVCIVAPFDTIQGEAAFVQVVRDITERQRMLTERETLIQDLGERLKEMNCLNALSELSRKPDLNIETWLAGVAALLPPAFLFPEKAHTVLNSSWGSFGHHWPENTPSAVLEQPIEINGTQCGIIKVWYPDDLQPKPFLPEESVMLRNVARDVGETIERLRDAEKVRQLSSLYEILSATNRSLVYCTNVEELLAGVFDALVTNSRFPMLFIALTDNGQMPLRLIHVHGIPHRHLQELSGILADPDSPFGRAFPAFTSGNVISTLIPPATHRTDDPHDNWLAWLHEQDISERATMPLMQGGRLMGVVGLYAVTGLSTFDEDQLRLLNEMAVDISYGLNTLFLDKRRQEAEVAASTSELRFQQVFESSPLPMQIHSLKNHTIRALNKAHRDWLGYSLEDIPTDDLWFENAFTDPVVRQTMLRTWADSILAAIDGQSVSSPELTLYGKDDVPHLARGSMTIMNDDMIIAWTDLTDIRRHEQQLIESEKRFRGMIEQTVSGIYVQRDSKFLYVNPRFCDLTGWKSGEVLGREVLELTSPDEANLEHIRDIRIRLQEKGEIISTNIPVRRKDGAWIELGLTAKVITWDDGLPATIAMVQDITEKKRNEDQIARYIQQLEGSMKATLQAISNMVELRDPYTAGHERRVGLIAGAIARELGWEAKRCSDLELIGLVHDIGKIAVPSEILTKPSRLSALEMEIIKCHAQAGYDILKDVPFEAPVAETIRQHHERMDGSGYPQGLKGNEILPEARVLAVADVVESMAAHRPYRAALGIEAALTEIERGRGSHYDADAVDALLRLVQEKGYVLPQ
ncbi:MAG: MASE3 domain-containing protein [Fluviicoccus sp.]|uniref:MASE3 domain-containing protein n=1 Tax=Fluviicoccus sp. TaxID=2003552 RepID=UPI002723810B|nr:MASE3 domain-containing protein [Fluviicoccus sp.]MDO8329957.1 MASE3 domain-containing protein [Fluviicoccus sp.]